MSTPSIEKKPRHNYFVFFSFTQLQITFILANNFKLFESQNGGNKSDLLSFECYCDLMALRCFNNAQFITSESRLVDYIHDICVYDGIMIILVFCRSVVRH